MLSLIFTLLSNLGLERALIRYSNRNLIVWNIFCNLGFFNFKFAQYIAQEMISWFKDTTNKGIYTSVCVYVCVFVRVKGQFSLIILKNFWQDTYTFFLKWIFLLCIGFTNYIHIHFIWMLPQCIYLVGSIELNTDLIHLVHAIYLSFSRSFLVQWVPFSMFGNPSGTGWYSNVVNFFFVYCFDCL